MARALTAFVKTGDVPSRQALQGALDPLGFKIVLDDDYRPLKTKGYVPCALDGEDAGFDLRFETPDETARARFNLDGETVAMAVRWGGDPREALAALGVVAALARDFGALVVEPGAATQISADEALGRARRAAQEL
ncbi:MAG TPA: hypothetical protein VMU18_06975 [Rhodoblastus sp.]|nr:hypothetical protein [Rhodoblastus sp.]